MRYPMNTRQVFSRAEDGTVVVTSGTRWGRFAADGRHLEGPLFEADPEMCLWISTPRPTQHHRTSRLSEGSTDL